MKLTAALLLAGTIAGTPGGWVSLTVQAEAADLSQHIQEHNPSLDKQHVAVIARELKKYPPALTYIVHRESGFNPAAHSKGCIGLAGVNARVWVNTLKEEKVIRSYKDLWTVKYNLKAGWWIYKHYNKSYRRYRGAK